MALDFASQAMLEAMAAAGMKPVHRSTVAEVRGGWRLQLPGFPIGRAIAMHSMWETHIPVFGRFLPLRVYTSTASSTRWIVYFQRGSESANPPVALLDRTHRPSAAMEVDDPAGTRCRRRIDTQRQETAGHGDMCLPRAVHRDGAPNRESGQLQAPATAHFRHRRFVNRLHAGGGHRLQHRLACKIQCHGCVSLWVAETVYEARQVTTASSASMVDPVMRNGLISSDSS